jgi:hypothetical protein
MGISDFLATPRNNVVSSVMTFRTIDTDGMILSLKLRERACEAGKGNFPRKESQNFDAAEQEIVNEIEAEGRANLEEYLEHQKTYADRARDTGTEAALLQLAGAASDAIADFDRETRTGTDKLFGLRKQLAEAEDDLAAYRAEHGLRRPVWHQETSGSVFGILIFILAVEAALNGYFLGKGSQFGFVGGLLDAIIIAGLNIAVGFAVGWQVVPWTSYRALPARLISAAVFIGYLIAAVLFNLGVAHYRIAMAADPFTASETAWQMLRTAPLAVQDLESWLLFVMGSLFSLTAVYEGWKFEDPYHGYGKRYRHSQNAQRKYNSTKESLLYKLETIKLDAEEKIDDAARSISSRDGERAHIAAKSSALRLALDQQITHLQSAGRTLLQYYRSENLKCRADPESVPARFDIPWIYAPPKLNDVEVITVNPEVTNERMRRALEEAPRHRGELHEAYRVAKDKYLQIEEIVGVPK